MGKRQWLLYKVAGDGGCNGREKPSSVNAGETKPAGKSGKRGERQTSYSSSGGCMSAIFHLFDIQHHHFPFRQPNFISESFINVPQEHNFTLKGVEAPRNSLELEEAASSSSSSSKLKQETSLNIPRGGIQMIKTKRSRLMDDLSSECSSSPGTKTPNLVARLMGLDLLPESSSPRPSLSSPRPSSSSSHAPPLNPNLSKLSSRKQHAARSLPATPRMSTAGRPSTEVDYHHRLSLKENVGGRRSEVGYRRDDEYAKQIAKQVLKESIRRRVGADITNMPEMKKEQRRDECLVLLKPRKPSPAPALFTGKQDETTSPRLRLLEIKNNLNKPSSNSTKSSPLSSSTEGIKAPASSNWKPPPLMKQEAHAVQVKKCKKIASEKYDLRLKKMHQQEEPFVKKCNKKSTPLSNHLLNVNKKTKFISFKKETASSPSSPATLPQKQVPLESIITRLPSCKSRSYNIKLSVQDNVSTREDNDSNGNAVTTTTTAAGASFSGYHFEYISRILSHSGVDKNTLISVTHWYSPSHPLHPSIFHHLEKLTTTTGDSTAVAGRKLIFDVVDELLVEILKPYISFKPWAGQPRYSPAMHGSELIGKLCKQILSFPAADCRILEDIDGLIERDMKRNTRRVGAMAFEEEAEELVTEIERDMVDTLVNEMAVMKWHVGCRGKL